MPSECNRTTRTARLCILEEPGYNDLVARYSRVTCYWQHDGTSSACDSHGFSRHLVRTLADVTACSRGTLQRNIKRAVAQPNLRCRGTVSHGHDTIRMPHARQSLFVGKQHACCGHKAGGEGATTIVTTLAPRPPKKMNECKQHCVLSPYNYNILASVIRSAPKVS